MGTTESDRKPRVLIFHGMRMSGSMLRELMTDVLSAFADQDWDWTFVDAANEPTGPPIDSVAKRWPQGPYREWWNAMERSDGRVEYVGLDRSIDFVRKTLAEHGHGVRGTEIGGGALVATLAYRAGAWGRPCDSNHEKEP